MKRMLSASQEALLRLSRVDGLGPAKLQALLNVFGSTEKVLGQSHGQLRQASGVGEKLAQAIVEQANDVDISKELRQLHEAGAQFLFLGDEAYPDWLAEIPSAPLVLTIKGDLQATDRAAIAVVGSRRCTQYGRKMAKHLAGQLAQAGVTVISGLARGIDAEAHRGALEAGGRTLAVLASGVGRIYPPEHDKLADQVAGQGALISEAPPRGEPVGGLFPKRNRLISGLSLGVVVVEASMRSGALSTARHALEQNREVFAVPGRVGDSASTGTNHLIQQGAKLVADVDDILSELGPIEIDGWTMPAQLDDEPRLASEPAKRSGRGRAQVGDQVTMPEGMDPAQQSIWHQLSDDPLSLEMVVERTELPVHVVSASLLMMEMRHWVKRQAGNAFVRG